MPLTQLVIDPAVRPLRNGSAVNLAARPDGSCLLTIDQMSVSERMILGIPLDISTMNEADFNVCSELGLLYPSV